MKSDNKNRRQGFTVLELLIVIGIIAIFGAFLFPTFTRAREDAKSTTCQKNLQQIGLAFSQYVQDYDGHYPRNGWCPASAPDCTAASPKTSIRPVLWLYAMDPYLKSADAYNCPSSVYPRQYKDSVTGQFVYNPAASYGWNVYSLNGVGERTPFHGVSVSKVEDAAGTVLVGDANGYYRFAGYHDEVYMNNSAGMARRHFSGTNILWADGHVKWTSASELRYTAGSKVPGPWTLIAGD